MYVDPLRMHRFNFNSTVKLCTFDVDYRFFRGRCVAGYECRLSWAKNRRDRITDINLLNVVLQG